MERISCGIDGLDEILGGGFIAGTSILIAGGPGTGKTIFSMEFLVKGALNDQSGIFVTLEERPDELRREAKIFGWDLNKLEEENKFAIVDAASSKAGLPTNEKYALRKGFDVNTLAQEIYRASRQLNAKRIVIDSISGLEFQYEGDSSLRAAIFRLSALLREIKCTSLMTSEMIGTDNYTRFGIEEFITQGLIQLFLREEAGELRRSILVRKMRGTSHSLKRYPFEIGNNGLIVLPSGEI
ncbi:MAG: AAA family ATPase [Candidatus Lokiarchaeota archaeon]|nr:AAA family ATPase [Candidatus Lokiarchaeota archaeon]